jgi:mono/diheme cytochrome c family protein
MRRRFIAAAVCLLALAATVFALRASWLASFASEQKPTRGAADDASIRRGAELAALGDCATCHTAPGGAPFAGGRAFATPFGTLYSTNITPDAETGIGRWSLDQFERAMREGIAPGGHLLYPAFPYPHFMHMTEADIASVYRFVMSRPALHAVAPKNRLAFPFEFRPLLAGWNRLFAHRAAEPSLVPADALARRGKYLVDSVGHCAACHTPLNVLGAEKSGYAFEGGVIEGWEAPSLTTLLRRPKPWTVDQLEAYLRTGFASEHGAAAGPMRPVTDSLGAASVDDIRAMVAYLMTLQAGESPTLSRMQSTGSALSSSSADRARLERGATLFDGACASCHGAVAPMSTLGDRPSLSLGTAVNAQTPRNAIRVILDGIPGGNGTRGPFMPAFAKMLTDAQIAEVATYMRSRFSTEAPWTLDSADVAKLRKETVKP